MDVEVLDDGFTREIASLLETERLARQTNGMQLSLTSTIQLFDLLRRRGDPAALLSTVTSICNKRAQFQRTAIELVRSSMTLIDAIADVGQKVAFVAGLKSICEKKIYLEVEFARCAMILVKYNEEATQDLMEANKIIEGVQVETYSSMDKREKFEFILHQMKLNLLLGDMLKLYIVSKKVTAKTLEDADLADLRLMFHFFMFHHAFTGKDFAGCAESLCGAYGALIQADSSRVEALDVAVRERFSPFFSKSTLVETWVVFKCLEAFSLKKTDALRALRKEHEAHFLESVALARLVDAFLSPEITSCSLEDYPTSQLYILVSPFEVQGGLLAALRLELVKKNCHVVALHFTNARIERLSQLFRADAQLIEEVICQMVFDELITAKIDRPARIVDFRTEKTEQSALNVWIENVNSILDLTDFVTERIQREEVRTRAE